MITTILLLFSYVLASLAAGAAVRWLKRRIPLPFFIGFWLLPIAFLFPCFFASQTPLPVDHAMLLPPWNTLASTTRHNANLNDAATQMAPWAKVVRMAWKEGSLPLRDRWNGCGTALAANGQSAAFSPLSLLMLPFPLAQAFTLAVALKLFLALCGMWLWLSELKVSPASALFGAVSFAFSFTMMPWLLFPHTSIICLWAWALLAIELLQDGEVRRRAFWALVLVFFLWPLGGHPESVALGAGFAATFLLVRSLCRGLREPAALFARIALAAATAVGLSAFLLLPQLFAIADSNRVRVAGEFWSRLAVHLAPHGPRWVNGFFTSVFPRSLGDSVESPVIQGSAGSFSEMSLAYFGIVGWAAVLLLFRPGSRRSRTQWALLAPLLLGFSMAVGLWPVLEIFLRLPVVRMMVPLRYFSWVALAGSALSAFELDRLRNDLSKGRGGGLPFLLALAALSAFAFATFARFRTLHAASGGLASQRNALVLALVTVASAALVIFVTARKPSTQSAMPLLLAAVTAAELLYQGRRLYRFGSPAQLFPETPLIRFLHAQSVPFRVLGEGATLFPNSNVFAGLEDIRTHDPVERRDYVDFLDATAGYNPADYFKNIQNINAPAVDFLNVKYLVSTPGRTSPGEKWKLVYAGHDGTVFENSAVLPRVFAPPTLRTLATAEWATRGLDGLKERYSHQDWKKEALLLRMGLKDFSSASLGPNGHAQISDYRESTNSVSFRANISPKEGGAILVASLVQDRGWLAQDEKGNSVNAGIANGPFLALRLSPGEHLVRLSYSPPGFLAGAGISSGTLCILAVLAARAWPRQTRRRSRPQRSRDFHSG